MAKKSGIAPLRKLLERGRIADGVRAEAYEQAPAPFRVALKGGIACLYTLYGGKEEFASSRKEYAHAGFGLKTTSKPHEAVAIIVPKGYSAAARLLPALVLPALFGVKTCFFLSLGTPDPATLTALELTGTDDAFTLNEETLCAFAKTFNGPLLAYTDRLPELARTPLILEKAPPVLTLLEPDVFSRDLLSLLHGQTEFAALVTEDTRAVFASRQTNERLQKASSPDRLYLSPGTEGFWMFPFLLPSLFRSASTLFYPLAKNPFA